jgi:hypothetical protein
MYDIEQDSTTGDLVMTAAGDIKHVESTRQHQNDILMARKGEYRLNPTGTVGIADYLDDENPDELQREIRVQLGRDGQKVNSLSITGDGNLTISASYE